MQQEKAATYQQKPKGKPRGRPFSKGQSGNPAGKPRGTPNKATVEVRALASELVNSPEYLAGLTGRLHAGKCAPAVEAMLWHYAHGKPPERHEIAGPDGEAPVLVVRWQHES